MKLVTVLLPEAYLEGLDELVRANMYPSRSSVIRSSVRDLLKKELWENNAKIKTLNPYLLKHKVCVLLARVICISNFSPDNQVTCACFNAVSADPP